MSSIAPGFTYSDTSGDANNQVSASNLATLVDGAAISGITKSEFATSLKLIEVSGSTPGSPSDGDMWYDTANSFFRLRRNGESDAPGVGFEGTNGFIDIVPQGAVCVAKGSVRNYSPCLTALYEGVTGVALATAEVGADSFLVSHGVASVFVTGGANPGDLLSSSIFTGYAIKTTSLTSALNAKIRQEFGIALTTCIGSGLCTAYIMG